MSDDNEKETTEASAASSGPIEVDLVGEFDISNALELRELLGTAIESGANPIVVNMADVTFIDSSGLGEFMRARNHVSSDRPILIRNLQPHIEKLFRVTGLASSFGVAEN